MFSCICKILLNEIEPFDFPEPNFAKQIVYSRVLDSRTFDEALFSSYLETFARYVISKKKVRYNMHLSRYLSDQEP